MSIQVKKGAASSSASPSRFLITTIGGRYLAFEAEAVQEILPSEEAGSLHQRIAQEEGRRPVDLATRLNLSDDHDRNSGNMVLLAAQGIRGSVRVEKVHGLLEVSPSQILPLPAHFRGMEQRWYRGMILFEGSVAMVLNTTWLLEDQAVGVDPPMSQREMRHGGAVQEVAAGKNLEC